MPTVSNPVKISALYAAFFNRAPDAEGLAYWEAKFNEGQDLSDISAGFVQHEVFVSTYGSLDDQQFVEAIYTNMLGNAGDAGGISYWVSKLGEGMSRSDMVAQFVEDSLTLDLDAMLTAGDLTQAEYDVAVERQNYLTNRAEVGKNFAETLGDATLVTSSGIAVQQDPAYLASIAVLQGVDATQASVDAANQMIIDASFAEDPAAFINNASQVAAGTTFNLTEAAAAGADAMRLTGDMDVRIDLTANDNQVRGLDLDGNGTIAADGVENNDPTTLDDGKDFEIVDAYSRNKLNEGDLTSNFLGDIAYDGTGFEGDGVNTDGNIFLGGLGADTALGGIGNDFMVGGGVATGNAGGDTLYGGRNADFFFGELSLLDNTDGNALTIHGGSTSDDAAVGNNTPQDSDWLLLEVSDDEDGTTVDLSIENSQFVSTGVGRTITMTEIENVDASGNLYGFVNDVDVALGANGQNVNGENVGIGSTAQLAILGSAANNILIGGFDNDRINGGAGNDLLFGGRLDYNNNPNIQNIVNDGRDELFGGAGDDHLVFEMDGGIYEGANELNVDANDNDTLWLTNLTFGTQSVNDLTTDGTVRLDLGTGLQGGLDNFAGYGGADAAPEDARADYTADQSNYADGVQRTAVQDVENVIATGLGAVDYQAAGTNDPELSFNNQQNIGGVDADLDLRGTTGDNTLYANTGDDVIEGRTGNDMLSGGEGNDDFIFNLQGGDDLDVIHRQLDANNDNLWDRDAEGNGLFGRDFGVNSTSEFGPSSLSVDFSAANLADVNVWMSSFSVVIGGETFAVADMAALAAVTNVADLADLANAAFQAQDSNVTVTANGTSLTITDATPTGGRDISDTQAEGYAVSTSVTAPGTSTLGLPQYTAPGETVSQDRLLFVSYTDRADNERVDDDAVFGGDSLGADAYAQDLVVGFDQDGSTVIAEDQAFRIDFENLTVEDEVTVSVNGVQFTLTVGRDLDGSLIADETTEEFVERLSDYIDDFLDDDTAAGKVASTYTGNADNDANTGFLTLTQDTYGSTNEETVFMSVDVNVEHNGSLGEGGTATITNESQSEITLFEFDGRDNALNAENVLFLGDSGNSRAVLETAAEAGGDLFGSDAIVVNVAADVDVDSSAAEGVNGAEIFFNDEENLTTGRNDNFAIHGDDQLFGGNGNDNVEAGTGDDRVYGSFGLDTIDGGKELYLVDGEIRVLNDYERDQVDALPTTVSIEQIDDGAFDDTLIFQQADFGTVGAGGSEFEITLDLSADQENGGAGKVVVDGDEATNRTLFTNMENIRTVSGNGTLAGQGNDTLDLSVSVDPLTGSEVINDFNMRYDLTSATTAGNVDLDRDNSDSFDAGETISKVDGVENVLFGTGDDVLLIDETEAGKNNLVDGGLGDDTVNYSFHVDINGDNADTAADDVANPAVTLTVNGDTNTDYVDMTGGLVGTDMPRDTLVSVETINFTDTLDNPSMDDTLDVTNVQDAVVDFVNGEVRDGNGNVQVEIGNMVDFEVVNADYSDTVIVADNMNNSRVSAADEDVQFNSFLNYDLIDGDNNRETIADMRSNNELNNTIPVAENIGLYTFNMGPDSDTVDYSNETGLVAAVANFDDATSIGVSNVLVSDNNNTDFADGVLNGTSNRVDAITGTENLVASQGNSIIDLTQATGGLKVRFNADDGVTENVAALDRDVFRVQLSELDTTQPITGMNFLSYEDAGDDAVITQATAEWNTVEGSDNNIMVELTDHETTSDHTFNLRGGDNEVNYNELTRSINTSVNITGTIGAADHQIEVTNTFTDGNNVVIGGMDIITTNTAQNAVAAGSLRIEASQDAEDSISFAPGLEKVFLLGEVVDGSDQITVTLGESGNQNSMVVTGYEILRDATSDDVYNMEDLSRVLNNLTLTDNATNDRDTLVVDNDAIDFQNAAANEINLEELNNDFFFDFDVLDITGVTNSGLTITGDTVAARDYDQDAGTADTATDLTNDELILGDLDLVDAVTNFDTLSLTDASVTSSGSTFDFDLTAGELQDAGDGTLFTFNGDAETLDASRVTSDLTLTITGGAATVIGGEGDDTITGDTGDDTLVGGKGADTLDGGTVEEVEQVITMELSGVTAGAGVTIIIGGVTLTEGVDFAAGDGADTIGALFAAAGAAAFDFGGGAPTSVSYDAATNELEFTFDFAEVVASVIKDAASTENNLVIANGAQQTAYIAPAESADTYLYNAADESALGAGDTIVNFDSSDTIDLSGIVNNTSVVSTSISGNDTLVRVDVDNDGINDMEMTLQDYQGVVYVSDDASNVTGTYLNSVSLGNAASGAELTATGGAVTGTNGVVNTLIGETGTADLFTSQDNDGTFDIIVGFEAGVDSIAAGQNLAGTVSYVDAAANNITMADIVDAFQNDTNLTGTIGSDTIMQFYNIDADGDGSADDSVILTDDTVNGTIDNALVVVGVTANITADFV